jgi:hypothetical protein
MITFSNTYFNLLYMKIQFLKVLLIAGAIPFVFNACKDDEPKPAGVGFETTGETVNESDGTLKSFHPLFVEDATGREIQVKLVLDKAVSETSVISYTVTGSAKRSTAAAVGDFSIEGNNITINKGEREAVLSIQLFEDFQPEFETYNEEGLPYEDIVITLESVVSGPIKLGEQTTYTLNVLEDDAVIFLVWDPQDDAATTTGDVDMDIFVWLENELWDYSNNKDTDIEYVVIAGGYPEGNYSMSYTYYNGSSNNLNFQVQMYGAFNGKNYPFAEETEPLMFTGNYTAVNKNTYPLEGEELPPLQIVQTMKKTGVAFTNVSSISKPASGSRMDTKAMMKLKPETLKQLLEKSRTIHKHKTFLNKN